MASTDKRKLWLDLAKGLAMFLVLVGHSMRDEMRQVSPVLDMIYRFCYIFHMSYFFFLSGYNYRSSRKSGRQPLALLGRRLKKQVPPWLLYTLFIYAVFSLAIRIPGLGKTLEGAGYGVLSLPAYLLSAIQANNPWAYHLWFLLVLMLLTTILALADGIFGGRRTKEVCVALAALGLVALAVQPLLHLGDWWRLFNYVSLYLPMVCLGVLLADWELPDRVLWIWGCGGLLYVLLRGLFLSGFSGNSLRVEGNFVRFLVYLSGDLLMPGAMLALNRLLDRGLLSRTQAGEKFFLFLGRKSMTIYLIHQPFCCAFLGMILYGKLGLPALVVMAVCMTVSLLVSWAAGKALQVIGSRNREVVKRA